MAPLPKLSRTGVIDQAVALVELSGFDALSVSAVAKGLEVAPSALYTYCDGLDGLRNLVATAATNNLTAVVRNAATGTYGVVALNAMGDAYRRFAHEHPGQFASTLRPPTVADDDLGTANIGLHDTFVLVFAAMGWSPDRSHLAARSTRSALHGFLALEHATGTSAEHDSEFKHLVDALIVGLHGDA